MEKEIQNVDDLSDAKILELLKDKVVYLKDRIKYYDDLINRLEDQLYRAELACDAYNKSDRGTNMVSEPQIKYEVKDNPVVQRVKVTFPKIMEVKLTTAHKAIEAVKSYDDFVSTTELVNKINLLYPKQTVVTESFNAQWPAIWKDNRNPFIRIKYKISKNEIRYLYGLKDWLDIDSNILTAYKKKLQVRIGFDYTIETNS